MGVSLAHGQQAIYVAFDRTLTDELAVVPGGTQGGVTVQAGVHAIVSVDNAVEQAGRVA